jgi:cytochrome P450 family 12
MALFRFKNLNFKNLASHVRVFSSQKVQVPTNDISWNDAKKFQEIPGVKGLFETIRSFALPGGRYFNKQLNELMFLLQVDYGNIFMIPGVFGQNSFVAIFDPVEIEKVFRAEGKFPFRRNLESFGYFRKQYRPDLFPASAGLAVE